MLTSYHTNIIYITRFFAAIMIVLFHFSPVVVWTSHYSILKNCGEAVNYFFFISGFVMIFSNKKYILNDKKYVFQKGDFWIKRFARICPIYVFALLCVVAFHYLVANIDTSILKRLPFEALAIQRWLYPGSINFPGWSISCELLFYAVFPLLIFFIKTSFSKYKFTVIICFVVATVLNYVLYIYKQMDHSDAVNKILTTLFLHPVLKIPIFALGTVCGIIYINKGFIAVHVKTYSVFYSLVCLAIIFAALFYLPKNSFLIEAGLLSFIYFIFLLSICNLPPKLTAIFNHKWIIFLGDISYGIYILQYPVHLFFKYFRGDIYTVQDLLIYLLTLIMAAIITYYLIEMPLKKSILLLYFKNKNNVALSHV